MNFILVGFIVSLIGGFPYCEISENDNWLKRFVFWLIGGTIVWSFVAYLFMPQLVGPFWGFPLTIMIWITLAANVMSSMAAAEYHKWNQTKVFGNACLVVAAAIILPTMRSCAGWSALNANKYRALAGATLTKGDWEQDLSPVDTAHIRMVSRQQAEWLGNKALGQADGSLGSRYKLGSYTVQRVANKLVWVAPLEFTGFRSWQRFGSTPGYVMVSAENPSETPRLVIEHELKFMPSANFSSNLERHLYTHGYQARGTMDYTFELDDEGNPFWVVTLYDYSIQYWAEQIQGVLTVNPKTGAITEYDDTSEVPAWVDRIIPEKVAFERLTWYGSFIHGWFNSWWGEEDVNIPTNPQRLAEMWLVWGSDNRAYWFSGFTSSKNSDSALVGFAMMDSRTGETKYYRLSGADESAVLQVANSAVSNYSGYHGTQPILYNIYGELTWVVPIISSENIFQKICFIRASTSESVLGETKREALTAYRRLLQSTSNEDEPSSQTGTQTLTGTLSRVGRDNNDGNTTYYFVVGTDPLTRIYTATSSVNYEVTLAKPGDEVEIRYFETGESVVPVSGFDIINLRPQAPPETPK